jgi:methionine synthase I (cobalamin-dependent)
MQLVNSHGDWFENINKAVRYYGADAVKTNTALSTNYDSGIAIKVSEISKRDIDLSRASARDANIARDRVPVNSISNSSWIRG